MSTTLFSLAFGVGTQNRQGTWLEVFYAQPLLNPAVELSDKAAAILGYQGGNQAIAISNNQAGDLAEALKNLDAAQSALLTLWGAMAMGAQHCDTFAMFGEPLAETAERMEEFRRMTLPFGRTPRFNVSFRPIIAETEGKAWDKAKKILDDLKSSGTMPTKAQDKSADPSAGLYPARRNDRYGGSIENRARFALEVVDAVVAEIGAGKVGIRLSPVTPFNDLSDGNPQAVFGYLIEQLNQRGIGFIHMIEGSTGGDRDVPGFDYAWARNTFKGTYIVNNGYTREMAINALETGLADAVSFGRAYISNPDLVQRLKLNAPLAEGNPATYYAPGPVGYIDYPALNVTA